MTSAVVLGEVDGAVDRVPSRDRAEALAGARAMAPFLLAYIPFGLVVGAAVAASEQPFAAWLATWGIYGGAAHLAVLDVAGQGAGWVTAAALGLALNARLVAYSAAMAPQWRDEPLSARVLAGVLLTDAPWAASRSRGGSLTAFYFGAAVTILFGWSTLVSAGALVGGWFGDSPLLHLLAPMTLGAVVVPQLTRRPVVAACAAGAMCAVVTHQLAAGPALVCVGVTGGVAGLLARNAS